MYNNFLELFYYVMIRKNHVKNTTTVLRALFR